MKFRPTAKRLLIALSILGFALSAQAQSVPDWPGLYDPFKLYTLHVETVNPPDFDVIRNDTTYDIEVPAWFWAGDEDPILVSIRRKSASALPNELDPNKKVSYKIDINEYHDDPGDVDICVDVPGITEGCVSKWKDVKKLSLENGDDQDVVQEGFAWYLHRLASESALNYESGLASWVKLYINGQYQGVYVNVEQPDKQFLKNRGMWAGGDDTWLHKMSDIDSPEFKEAPEDASGEPISSPASELLCFKPFVDKGACRTPGNFKDLLEQRINMEGMLTLGAVTAFHYSPDDLFAKGKNFYYIDYSDEVGLKREYTQWDLDSAFGSMNPDLSMFSQGKGRHDSYEKSLVEASDAPFREEYEVIIDTLVNGGVFEEDALLMDLLAMQELLATALEADPNSKGAQGSFDVLTQYVPLRLESMRSQLPGPPPPAPDGVHIGDLDGNSLRIDRRQWDATLTVTVHDQTHTAVVGATVNGSWSGGIAGDTSCVTGINGTCQLTASVTSKRFKKVNFAVAGVVAGAQTYVEVANHDVDGDSDGTSISIPRP